MNRDDSAMKTGLWILFYAMLFYIGTRAMRGKGYTKELVLYACVVGWCMYLSLADIYTWPMLTIASPMNVVFTPVGKWIDQLWKAG